MRSLGLRNRVTLAFGALFVAVALVVSVLTFTLARVDLTRERQDSAVSRAASGAQVVNAVLRDRDGTPEKALVALTAVGGSQHLIEHDGRWYADPGAVTPAALPRSLTSTTVRPGTHRQFRVGNVVYLGVAHPVRGGVYVEVSSFVQLDRTLRLIGWILLASALLALLLGVLLGRYAAGRLLRSLRRVVGTANALADGDLGVRMEPTGDRDLEPITTSFNAMAQAVEDRVERERRLVADVSHELRTPVTVVLGTTELLARHATDLPPDDARLLALLGEQVSRLGKTVTDLLDLHTTTVLSEADLHDVDPAEMVRSLLADRRVECAVSAPEVPAVVRTDGRRLERVLANLVDNAQTHGRGLRSVTVTAADDAVTVVLDDRGPGIAAAERARVFEAFARGAASEPGTGSGLGLAIVREQAASIGAEVSVEDAAGGGARLVVRLPRRPVLV